MRDWIILTVVLTVVSGVAVGCSPPPAFTANTRPPGGATNLENVHNGWYTFEWRGECFLLKSGGRRSYGLGHITTISCGDDDEN